MDNWVVEVSLPQGLRRQVWGTIGEQTGRTMGEILGTGMDALILHLEEVFEAESQ